MICCYRHFEFCNVSAKILIFSVRQITWPDSNRKLIGNWNFSSVPLDSAEQLEVCRIHVSEPMKGLGKVYTQYLRLTLSVCFFCVFPSLPSYSGQPSPCHLVLQANNTAHLYLSFRCSEWCRPWLALHEIYSVLFSLSKCHSSSSVWLSCSLMPSGSCILHFVQSL